MSNRTRLMVVAVAAFVVGILVRSLAIHIPPAHLF